MIRIRERLTSPRSDSYRAARVRSMFNVDGGEEALTEVCRDPRMQAAMAGREPPAVGLPVLMGAAAPAKVANMVAAITAGDIQPVEMIFRKG